MYLDPCAQGAQHGSIDEDEDDDDDDDDDDDADADAHGVKIDYLGGWLVPISLFPLWLKRQCHLKCWFVGLKTLKRLVVDADQKHCNITDVRSDV